MKLFVKHPYYISESNYYSNEVYHEYETFQDYVEDWKDYDIDMNLIIRFDVKLIDEDMPEKGYGLQLGVMLQRKGIYTPIWIKKFTEADEPLAIEVLQKHFDRIKENWAPFK